MMALGAAATLLIFWLLVPGPDIRPASASDSSGAVELK
jgi:hypothetical protein